MTDPAVIQLLPGMSFDYPVYSRLVPLLPNVQVLNFITPHSGESLKSYAKRMAENCSPAAFIGGISFGGIVAYEIACEINPPGCIQIASISDPNELPPWFQFGRLMGGWATSHSMNIASHVAATVPARIQSSTTMRLSQLRGEQGSWHRWAVSAVLDWSPSRSLECPSIKIHGSHDRTFPIQFVHADVVIERGTHNLPVSNPSETAAAVHSFVQSNTFV